MDELPHLRRHYSRAALRQHDLPGDPLTHARDWIAIAIAEGVPEPNAASLATATTSGAPSCRTVLVKGLDQSGFHFFTNLASRKARQLAENPQAALSMVWLGLERQLLVEGQVYPLSREMAAGYFAGRPYESQIGAWASAQSEPVNCRADLESSEAHWRSRFPEGTPVPLPDHWGGYALLPLRIEFWQGRPGRLHDRILFCRTGANAPWSRQRLSP
jgi:pyridoxamine 5'-phosphate oxidase